MSCTTIANCTWAIRSLSDFCSTLKAGPQSAARVDELLDMPRITTGKSSLLAAQAPSTRPPSVRTARWVA